MGLKDGHKPWRARDEEKILSTVSSADISVCCQGRHCTNWGLLPFPREHRKGEAGDRFLLLGALHSDFSGGRSVYASCDMPLCEVVPSHGDFFYASLWGWPFLWWLFFFLNHWHFCLRLTSRIFFTLGHIIQQSGSKHAYFSGQSPFLCSFPHKSFKGLPGLCSRLAPATVSQSCLMPLLFRTLPTTPLLLLFGF